MSRSGCFIAAALLLHGVLMVSIVDIYFRSPITDGMQPQHSPLKPPAKRLVLISSDGLRADKFFEGAAEEPSQTPFLRRVLTTRATWGVSHTRVPTESRPGHVAMIGGFYEDPAALLQGWQANPVPFDTVWNQSRYTWQIGSPDVVPMFAKAVPHVETHCFPDAWINFSGDPRGVDTWVLDTTQRLVAAARHNASRYSLLMESKIVFFLHLLGMDTAGHQFRPQSTKYTEVLRNVDRVVEGLHSLFETLWPDGRTAYIFTSDHGMSNRGSHGDGSVDETRCPIVAWGAGLSAPKPRPPTDQLLAAQSLTDGMVWLDGAFDTLQQEKEYIQQKWRLDPEQRVDMLQADLAPLMATLIGVPIPVHSVGVLNTHYLDATEGFKAIALLTNARQILEQCHLLAGRRRARSHLSYTEFPGLRRLNATVEHIFDSMNHSRYGEAHHVAQTLAREAHRCIAYYHKYDWLFLRNVISMAYVLWIVCSVIFVLATFGNLSLPRQRRASWLWGLLCLGSAGVLALLALREAPPSHYVYCGIVVGEMAAVLVGWPVVARGIWGQLDAPKQVAHAAPEPMSISAVLASAGVHAILVETMVFGFYDRAVYSLAFVAVGLGFGVPYVWDAPRRSRLLWLAGCLSLTPYPWLPVDAGAWPAFLVVAVALAVGLTVATDSSLAASAPPAAAPQRWWVAVQLTCAAVQCVTCLVSDAMLRQQRGLPAVNRVVAWSCIAISLAVVGRKQPSLLLRIRAVALGLLPAHVALSVAYESAVYVQLAALMLLWLWIAAGTAQRRAGAAPVPAYMGCALLFFFFMNAAFFTTGNLASISSFELSSVYRLTTQFNPLFMASLLIAKNLIPWMAVVMPFVAFMKLRGQPPLAMFALTFVHSDAMALQFFFLVQDRGSWKEIGHSISRFGIANCTIIVILMLSAVSGALLHAPDFKHKE